MPKGSPNAQTVASEKYQKKAGYMTKGFKLKRDVAERFAEACEKAGVSQAAQITAMMIVFCLLEYLFQNSTSFAGISCTLSFIILLS